MTFPELFKSSYIQLLDDRKYWKEKPPLPSFKQVFPISELTANLQKYKELNRQGVGVFYTPNPCVNGRKEGDVKAIEWVFVDMDSGTKEEQMERINAAPIPPNMLVESQRSFHCYWRCNLEAWQFKTLIKGLILYFNGDPALDSANEVLRFPGFLHNKFFENPFEVMWRKYEDKVFEYKELAQAYPEPTVKWARQYGLRDDDLGVVKSIPIKEVLNRFGVQYNQRNELIENGEVTSAVINVKENYINRFSGKPPRGSVIDVVMYFNNMQAKEAIQWLKETFGVQKAPVLLQTKTGYEKRYTWGTEGLNHKFAIIKREKLIVVYGTRGQGKTTYVFDMALKNAGLGHKVLFFSLEMEREPLLNKLCNDFAGITIEEEYHYKIPEHKLEKAKAKRARLEANKNLVFLGMRQAEDKTWENILSKILGHADLDLVVIDNLDLVAGGKGENNNDKQMRIIKDMMGFVSKYRVPLVLLHHQRKFSAGGKSNGMDDMAGSGKVADTADYVVRVVRDTTPDLPSPQKYETVLILEKAREYGESMHSIFFDRGNFVDCMEAARPVLEEAFWNK